jgi:tetratricopeptide (TPR) repeat protein
MPHGGVSLHAIQKDLRSAAHNAPARAETALSETATHTLSAPGSTVAARHVTGPSERPSPQRVAPPPHRTTLSATVIANARRAFASYAALGASAAIVILLGLVMFSPDWDPAVRGARAELNAVLRDTRIGPLRLTDGPGAPSGPLDTVRGQSPLDHPRIDRLELSLSRLLRRYPHDPDIHIMAGHLHLIMSRFDRAEVAYRRADRFAPENGRALNDLAVVAYRRGETAAALALLIDSSRRDAVPPEVFYNLGMIHHRSGDLLEARRYLEAYISRDPYSPWAARARSFIRE